MQQSIAECQPLADKLDANNQTKKDRKLELKRLAEHAAGNLDEGAELTVLMIISAETVKSYCADNAKNSVDKYCGSKGREHRERRRLAALALAATNEGNEEQ